MYDPPVLQIVSLPCKFLPRYEVIIYATVGHTNEIAKKKKKKPHRVGSLYHYCIYA